MKRDLFLIKYYFSHSLDIRNMFRTFEGVDLPRTLNLIVLYRLQQIEKWHSSIFGVRSKDWKLFCSLSLNENELKNICMCICVLHTIYLNAFCKLLFVWLENLITFTIKFVVIPSSDGFWTVTLVCSVVFVVVLWFSHSFIMY